MHVWVKCIQQENAVQLYIRNWQRGKKGNSLLSSPFAWVLLHVDYLPCFHPPVYILTTQDAAPRFHMHVCAYPKQLAWIGMQVLAARKWCLIMHVIWMPQLCARWASKIFPHIDCFTHWFIVNLFLHECSVQHVQWVCE